VSGSIRYYAATDQLGSVTQVTDSSGKAVWQSEYAAFGVVAGAQGSIGFDGMFAGEDIDPDTHLTYHWNRWRSEDGSSFISEDPARDGINWYSYVRNSPLTSTDPTGLWGWSNFWGGLLDIGLAIGAFAINPVLGMAVMGAELGGGAANGTSNPFAWNWSSSKTWGDIFLGTAIGVGAGLAGGWVASQQIAEGLGLSGRWAATLNGALGGSVGGFLNGFFNAALLGGKSASEALRQGGLGAAFGFVLGGIGGYLHYKPQLNEQTNLAIQQGTPIPKTYPDPNDPIFTTPSNTNLLIAHNSNSFSMIEVDDTYGFKAGVGIEKEGFDIGLLGINGGIQTPGNLYLNGQFSFFSGEVGLNLKTLQFYGPEFDLGLQFRLGPAFLNFSFVDFVKDFWGHIADWATQDWTK